jgi:hypothetical protein
MHTHTHTDLCEHPVCAGRACACEASDGRHQSATVAHTHTPTHTHTHTHTDLRAGCHHHHPADPCTHTHTHMHTHRRVEQPHPPSCPQDDAIMPEEVHATRAMGACACAVWWCVGGWVGGWVSVCLCVSVCGVAVRVWMLEGLVGMPHTCDQLGTTYMNTHAPVRPGSSSMVSAAALDPKADAAADTHANAP